MKLKSIKIHKHVFEVLVWLFAFVTFPIVGNSLPIVFGVSCGLFNLLIIIKTHVAVQDCDEDYFYIIEIRR